MDEFRKTSLNMVQGTEKIMSEILDFDDQSGVGPMIREADSLNETMTDVVKTFLDTSLKLVFKKIFNVEERFFKLDSDWNTYKSE